MPADTPLRPPLPRLCFLSYRAIREFARPVLDEMAARAQVEVVDGSFERALSIAHHRVAAGRVDVFVSAGANAALLRAHLRAPVATIALTGFDILQALMRARGRSKRVGIVMYGQIIPELEAAKALLNIGIEQHAYTTPAEAAQCIARLKSLGIGVVVGSSLVVEAAQAAGLRAVLAYSLASIRQGFEHALDLARVARLEAERWSPLQALLHNLPDAVLAVDAQGLVTAANPAMQQALGLPALPLAGRRLADLPPELGLQPLLQGAPANRGVLRLDGRDWVADRRPLRLPGAGATGLAVAGIAGLGAGVEAGVEADADAGADTDAHDARAGALAAACGAIGATTAGGATGSGAEPAFGATLTLTGADRIHEADGRLRSQQRRRQQAGGGAAGGSGGGGGARWRFEQLLGQDAGFQRVLATARRYAATELAILIRGETGTGKELLAQAIHQASPRAQRPFIAVNCAALPEGLLESELFGHEEGAFTGARRGGQRGLFEAAHTGTLFLDEIGDMPPALQARLLRVLQEREIQRLGAGAAAIAVDVRVIAATHQPLPVLMAQGRFRPDLFHRLDTLRLTLPPLRERPADIPLLARALLAEALRRHAVPHAGQSASPHAGQAADRQGSAPPPEALLAPLLPALQRHPWPGNVRELANVVERLAVFARHQARLSPPELADFLAECPDVFGPAGAPAPGLAEAQGPSAASATPVAAAAAEAHASTALSAAQAVTGAARGAGEAGPAGGAGAAGVAGVAGVAVAAGVPGATGLTGATGASGATGSTGAHAPAQQLPRAARARAALHRHGGRVQAAAEELGINRSTLWRWLRASAAPV